MDRQVCGSAHEKIRSRLWQGIQDEEARQDSKSLSCFSIVLCNATTETVKALVSIMKSVSWSNEGRPLKLRHHDSSRAPFKRSPETHLHPTSSTRPSETWRRQSWQINQENVWNSRRGSHNWQLDHVTLICGELGGFRRGKHSAAFFHNSNEHVRMAVHGDDIVCLSDDDGSSTSTKLLKSQNTAKDMETLGFEESDLTALGH